jgi:pyruvate/2-oxoacid:ferredoxin oxidoreductase beta subunit
MRCVRGMEEDLWYVYEGKVPGEGAEHAYCHGCGTMIIERRGLELIRGRLQNKTGPECGTVIDGVGMQLVLYQLAIGHYRDTVRCHSRPD